MGGLLFSAVLFMLLFMLVLAGLIFFALVFWIWMLVDCLQKKKFDDKLAWVLVLVFLNVLGAVLYYFLVKRGKKKK